MKKSLMIALLSLAMAAAYLPASSFAAPETDRAKLITYTVTFKVAGGSWNDGTATEKKVAKSRYEDEDLALYLLPEDIPAAGGKPAEGYRAGAWNVTPSTDRAITKDETFIYVYDKAPEPKPTTKPAPTTRPGPGPTTEPGPAPERTDVLIATARAKGKTKMKLTWTRVEGASGYDIFFARCNGAKHKPPGKLVKTIKGNSTFKWTKGKLKKGKSYKAYVKAFVMKNGQKIYIAKSPTTHAYAAGGTKSRTNAKKVTVKKKKVTLKKGGTYKVRAKVKKLKKSRKLFPKKYTPRLRYLSSDPKVATVTKGGRIKAKASGTCRVYVFAHNGVYRTITVKVR